jgi:5-methylcytosine-specific restriction endonuclease McrA
MWWQRFKTSDDKYIQDNISTTHTPEELSDVYWSNRTNMRGQRPKYLTDNDVVNINYPIEQVFPWNQQIVGFIGQRMAPSKLKEIHTNLIKSLSDINKDQEYLNLYKTLLSNISKDIRQHIFKNPPKCLYCGDDLTLKDVEIDHFIPDSFQVSKDVYYILQNYHQIETETDVLIKYLKDVNASFVKENYNLSDKICNRLKRNMQYGDFIKWCTQVGVYKPDLKYYMSVSNKFKLTRHKDALENIKFNNNILLSIIGILYRIISDEKEYISIFKIIQQNKLPNEYLEVIDYFKGLTSSEVQKGTGVSREMTKSCVIVFKRLGLFQKYNIPMIFYDKDSPKPLQSMNQYQNLKYEIIGRIKQLLNLPCYICGEDLEKDNYHIDHLLAKSTHNDSILPTNFFPTHSICNFSKGDVEINDVRKRCVKIVLYADPNKKDQNSFIIFKALMEALKISDILKQIMEKIGKDSSEYIKIKNIFDIENVQNNLLEYQKMIDKENVHTDDIPELVRNTYEQSRNI